MPAKSTFTPDEDARALEMIRDGKTAREIADALGKPASSIHSRIRQTWKVCLPSARKTDRQAILNAVKSSPGTSASKVATAFGVSEAVVRRVVRDGMGPGTFAAAYRWSQEELGILARMASNGSNSMEIAEALSSSPKAVRSKARELGVKVIRLPGSGHGTSDGAKKRWDVAGRKDALSERMRGYWADPGRRKEQSDRASDSWEGIRSDSGRMVERSRVHREARCRPDVVNRLRDAQRNGSSIERVLWGILGGLGLEEGRGWEKHFQVGPYQFDVLLRRQGKADLLVECNGSYWHSLGRVQRVDDSKRTYVGNYFADKYEVRTLWEHEFLAVNRVADTVRRWIGLEETRHFDFSQISVGEIQTGDARDFLGRYHYLGGIGRGGVCAGASLGEELIAVAVFSHLARQNIAGRLGEDFGTTRELSRLAIKPDRHVENFGSWFLSRAVKQEWEKEPEVRLLVSYADETYGHSGGLYRAAGWQEDGEVAPDYWYVDGGGFVTGKQALYRHASRMGMTEAEFAGANGLAKVFGRRKLRFVLRRS